MKTSDILVLEFDDNDKLFYMTCWLPFAKSFHFFEVERISIIIHLDNDISAWLLLTCDVYQ